MCDVTSLALAWSVSCRFSSVRVRVSETWWLDVSVAERRVVVRDGHSYLRSTCSGSTGLSKGQQQQQQQGWELKPIVSVI